MSPRLSSPPQIDRESIARRAYELFASRGYEHGRDQEDWFAAEAELRARMGGKPASRGKAAPAARRSGKTS